MSSFFFQSYLYDHNTTMQPGSIAQLLSTLLYSRRFFPYYVYNVLAGLDDNGEGCLYSYDPVGHCEKVSYTAGGSSGVLMQPFLDSWVIIIFSSNLSRQESFKQFSGKLINNLHTIPV